MIMEDVQGDYGEEMQRCIDYMEALEEERRKIQVFQRELPLCLDLVTRAIEGCKQRLSGTTMTTVCFRGHSACSEQTSTDGPVLEEFIPIKRTSVSTDDDDEDADGERQQSKKPKDDGSSDVNDSNQSSMKLDWLKSAQLWNQSPDPSINEESFRRPMVAAEVRRNGNGGAFLPFKREKGNETIKSGSIPARQTSPVVPAKTASSPAAACNENRNEEKEKQSQRKARRCWSPELHKRFLRSLEQLGGAHVATPKQIRDLMKVDGLTNDEVKSHLQKYRLHTRRPSPTIHSNNNNNEQATQFVVVRGLWMPSPDYVAMAASGDAASHGICYAPMAPVATAPQSTTRQKKKVQHYPHSDQRGGHSDGLPDSPVSSSSTPTTSTAPPAL